MKIKINLINKNFYKIVINPINSNYSNIIANFIRKLLFINSEGVAITELEFLNKLHEYDIIRGVKEDILNIISNLKELVFFSKKKKLIINCSRKGPLILKGKDLENKKLKVVNSNKILANLSENSSIKFKLKLEKGKGFIPFSSKNMKKKKSFKNGIILDACFCPIISVFYYIKNFKNLNNFSCIEFFVKTNGSINLVSNFKFIFKNFLKELSIFSYSKIYKNLIDSKKFFLYNNSFFFFNFYFLKKKLLNINFNKKDLIKLNLNFFSKYKILLFLNYIKIYEN